MSGDLKRLLQYAVEAARYGSFQRAALALGIEESSLSRGIRQLEGVVGVALFIRSRVGVRLTSAGDGFMPGALHVIQELDRMIATARAIGHGEAGGLSVGFFASITAGNLRATVFEFEDRFPGIELRGVEDERPQLMAALVGGSIDLAVVSGSAQHPGLVRQTFWSERMMVALHKDHPLAAREGIYWSDLREETFLGSRFTGAEVHDLVLARLVQPGHRPRFLQRYVTRESILGAVSAGRGVTLVSEAASGMQVTNVVLRPLHDLGGPLTLGYSGYWRSDNPNPALKRLLQFIRARYSLADGPD